MDKEWMPVNPCEDCAEKKITPTYSKCTLACGRPHEYQVKVWAKLELLDYLIAKYRISRTYEPIVTELQQMKSQLEKER